MTSMRRSCEVFSVFMIVNVIVSNCYNAKDFTSNKDKTTKSFGNAVSIKSKRNLLTETARQECPPTRVVVAPPSKCPHPSDCEDYLRLGYNASAVYRIWPRHAIMDGRSIEVYCDMDTDKGGWTVLQRRGNFLREADYFFKNWTSYKKGFGDIERDFWLGNDNIFALTQQKVYSVRFDLADVNGSHSYALYDIFWTESEDQKYKLTIEDYSGTAGDSMKGHNGQHFSTKDNDNDKHPHNCAEIFKGAWWYKNCHESNLNGLYLRGKTETYADGVVWRTWGGYHDSLDETEIKIRSKDFRRTLVN